jgi:cell division protein ZapE
MASEARRFTWLVDVLYDHRIKLLMSAEVAPEQLFTEGSFATEFQRSVSRIVEMQSREYKESDRRKSAAMMVKHAAD